MCVQLPFGRLRFPFAFRDHVPILFLYVLPACGSRRTVIFADVDESLFVLGDVDMVAGDFKGASWRPESGPDQQFDRTFGGNVPKRKAPCATTQVSIRMALTQTRAFENRS